MLIDCDRCAIRGVGCADCVISVLLDAPPRVEIAEPELRAIGVLADVGLVPRLRLVPTADGAVPQDTPCAGTPSAERSRFDGGRPQQQVS